MRVEVDRRAAADLDNIYNFIAADSPRNAAAVVNRILTSIARLAEFPGMARRGIVSETRELVIPRLPYIAVYRVDRERDILTVLAVFHGAQKRDDL